jgi:hypothetical protein
MGQNGSIELVQSVNQNIGVTFQLSCLVTAKSTIIAYFSMCNVYLGGPESSTASVVQHAHSQFSSVSASS